MKKVVVLAVLALSSSGAFAGDGFSRMDHSGDLFLEPISMKSTPASEVSAGAVQVRDLANYTDHAKVTLSGHLSKHIRGSHYTFVDEVGSEIEVDISTDVLRNVHVKPGDTITLEGTLEKSHSPMDILVSRINIGG